MASMNSPNEPSSDAITQIDWHLPTNVSAFQTNAYGHFTVATHIPHNSSWVAKCRGLLPHHANIHFLEQVHGRTLLNITQSPAVFPRKADGSYTSTPNQVCAVMTADCVPVLLCSEQGDWIAAVHAGWRGLAAGIIRDALAIFKASHPKQSLRAWIGPCICDTHYEVNAEFSVHFPQDTCAVYVRGKKHHLNLRLLAERQLQQADVREITHDRRCTYINPLLYSHRRLQHCADTPVGRMLYGIVIHSGT